MARFTTSIHVRFSKQVFDATGEAATLWYRGNRTDLVRDAVTQHLDRLYSGQTKPAPLAGVSYASNDDAEDEVASELDSNVAIW
jgi:hypothetical protein